MPLGGHILGGWVLQLANSVTPSCHGLCHHCDTRSEVGDGNSCRVGYAHKSSEFSWKTSEFIYKFMGGTTKRVLVNQHKLGDTGKLHACAIFHLRPFLVDSAEFAKQVKRAFCCIIYYVIDESSVIIFLSTSEEKNRVSSSVSSTTKHLWLHMVFTCCTL